MKYFSLASVALLGAATVSAGPLGIREDIGQCPKGYTVSVYYKTIYPESTAFATVESTVAPSSTAALVQSVSPVAAVEVSSSTTTSSAPVAETTAAEAAVVQTSAVESAAVINLISPSSIGTTAAAETTAAPVVAQVPTSSVETTTAAETAAAAVIAQIPTISAEAAAVETTAAPVVKAVSTTSTTSSSSSGENSGSATFYGGNVSGGTCSFSSYTLPSTLFGTALSADRWDNAANCGSCVSVTGPNGKTIKAMVVDQCPECESNHLDLFQSAFAELSDISAGVINIDWSYVSCDLDGPIKLKNKEGTSAYWFSMQVINANEAVTKLEVSTDGGSSWKSTTRTYYNYFEDSSGFGTDTVDVRVTGSSGKTVVVKNVGCASGSEVTASSNLS
ncbi:hypothetical protein PENARI_c002G03907 [Penicillium arizonense]|uniref:Expansin-like EG45 domain-containing protein n=1 Tax=Penicillium arizonense TaxID=1835702 RepID=A0A1F5LUQ5_PENAI|nr:hypothetical protein PENARI_c002G03907 [Penicillium arizonense]OGE56913.1 hypothetical protein PENARI_c002G03907 [Penicillium arizonense]